MMAIQYNRATHWGCQSQEPSGLHQLQDEQKLPHPMFSASGPQKYPSGPNQARLNEARMSLLTADWSLEQMAAGPHDYIY